MFEAEAMEAEYVTDPETGEQVEVSQGGVSINGFGVDVYAMTETEAQALRELIGSVKRSIDEDDVILDTVSDECSAYFSGARSPRRNRGAHTGQGVHVCERAAVAHTVPFKQVCHPVSLAFAQRNGVAYPAKSDM